VAILETEIWQGGPTKRPHLTAAGALNAHQTDKNWKLKLRYGKPTTPFHHYTAIAEGVVGKLAEGFSCPPGTAFMGMKTWASSTEESGDMITAIGSQIGFTITGDIQIYETEPEQPPRDKPFGYDIKFTPFDSEADE
jgi:hypothetical protein